MRRRSGGAREGKAGGEEEEERGSGVHGHDRGEGGSVCLRVCMCV